MMEWSLIEVTERFGKNLTCFKLRHRIWTAGTVARILENMSELEELKIELRERETGDPDVQSVLRDCHFDQNQHGQSFGFR